MKPLKSIVLLALIMSTSLASAQWGKWKKVKGNGDITTITRSTGDYDGLKAQGSMDFKLVPGSEGKITIKGDSNLMEYIKTEVKDNKLVVKVKDGINLKPTKSILITVPYKDISHVSLAGSGDIFNEGTIKSNDFDVALAGSGDIILNISSQSTQSSLAGSGDIELKGSTTNLKTSVAGSGDFDGSRLESTNVDAAVSGSGDISVVCNGKLKARVSGSGDIVYSGNPTNKDTKVSGSGDISN
ncbi:head GIN domain-containing protein [Winogradskyella poriferorum]|uniref:head GIN domain-containing protein n=1 Tax=Winogradskyella poriferorum TaxID=307627 RepID=UPI003D653E30